MLNWFLNWPERRFLSTVVLVSDVLFWLHKLLFSKFLEELFPEKSRGLLHFKSWILEEEINNMEWKEKKNSYLFLEIYFFAMNQLILSHDILLC